MQNLAREYQKNDTFNYNKKTDSLHRAFLWLVAEEGSIFWHNIHVSKSIQEARSNMTTTDRVKLDRILTPKSETYTKTSCHGSNAEYPTEQGSYFCFDERNQMIVMDWVGEKEIWNKIDWWLKIN